MDFRGISVVGGLCHRSSSKLLEGLGVSSDKIHDILLDL